MIKYLKLWAVILVNFTTFAQGQTGRVEYNFHLNLQNYHEGYIYNAELLFENTESLFVYNSVELEGKTGFRKSVKYRSGNITGGIYSRSFDNVGNMVYTNRNVDEMASRELLNGKYPVTVIERIPRQDWKVTNKTKNIGKFICYKARLEDFRGRDYTAWFTYELPISVGPWKFQGLPGLILEVYDDASQIHIVAESVQYPVGENVLVERRPNETEVLSIDAFLEENFKLYESHVESQTALHATGRIKRKVTPLPYRSIEYNDSQIKHLNESYAIDLSE